MRKAENPFLITLVSISFWLISAMAFANGSSDTSAARRALQQFKLCSTCHGAKGEGNIELKAPAIAGMKAWYVSAQLKKFRSRARGAHPSDLPGMRMGPMAKTLREADVEPMANLVASLPIQPITPTISGNPERGKQMFGVCVACHGADATGNEALGSPSLIGQSDWYMKSQIKNFQKGVRGGDPAKDPVGATMAPMARTLPNDQAIDDVIDYILALQGMKGTPKK